MKLLLMPDSSNLLEILLPPPWMITGINPNLFNIEILWIKLLNKSLLTNLNSNYQKILAR